MLKLKLMRLEVQEKRKNIKYLILIYYRSLDAKLNQISLIIGWNIMGIQINLKKKF